MQWRSHTHTRTAHLAAPAAEHAKIEQRTTPTTMSRKFIQTQNPKEKGKQIMNPEQTQEEEEQRLALKQYFEIQYAVFFNYTTTSTQGHQAHHHERLIPYSKKQKCWRNRGGGAWLSSSSSTASLFLFRHTCQSPLVLLISLAATIQEEHFISKLHFSWPKMSCVSQSPLRGSRVVFASYKDSMGQIQKFAMRFTNSLESKSFIDSLKESLKDVDTIGAPPSSNFLSGQPENELIQLDGVHHGNSAELNPFYSSCNDTPLVQASVSHGVENAVSEETLLPANIRSADGNLPPSFTAFLGDSSTETQEVATGPLKFPMEVDLFSHLAKNLSDSAFNVMLGKLEKFIRDTGGDMALQVS